MLGLEDQKITLVKKFNMQIIKKQLEQKQNLLAGNELNRQGRDFEYTQIPYSSNFKTSKNSQIGMGEFDNLPGCPDLNSNFNPIFCNNYIKTPVEDKSSFIQNDQESFNLINKFKEESRVSNIESNLNSFQTEFKRGEEEVPLINTASVIEKMRFLNSLKNREITLQTKSIIDKSPTILYQNHITNQKDNFNFQNITSVYSDISSKLKNSYLDSEEIPNTIKKLKLIIPNKDAVESLDF